MQLQNFLLYIHLIALGGAVLGIMRADESAFSWMRGKTPLMSPEKVNRIHLLVSISLSMLIVTGLWLFWPLRSFLLQSPYFLLKMGFVALLVLNSILIEYLMPIALTTPFAQVPLSKKLLLIVSGGVSFVSWVGAATAAYIIFGWLF